MAGLLVNTTPIPSIIAIGVVALRGTSTRLTKGVGFRKVEWAVVLCLAYWLASYCWSTGDFNNLVSYDFLRNDGAMLISYSAFIFFLGWPLKVRECRAFWMIFLTILAFTAFAGAAQSLDLPFSGLIGRFVPVYGDPALGEDAMFVGWFRAHNTAGGVYAIATVLALAFLLEPGGSRKQKFFRWALVMGCLGGLVLTYSRGAYFGFVAGAAILLPLRKLRRNFKIVLALVVPALLILVMSNSVLARLDSIDDPYYGNNTERIVLWTEALRDFADSPFIGMGYGRFNDLDLQYWGVKNVVWVAVRGKIVNNDSHAHNSYLHFLAEGGIIGLWLTMAVWWYAWKELSFFTSHFPRSKLYWLEKGATAGLAAALVQALTEHAIGRGSVVLVLDALIGLTLAAARLEAKAAKASQLQAGDTPPVRRVVTRAQREPVSAR